MDAAEAAKMIEGYVPNKEIEPQKKKVPSKFMQMRAKEKEKHSEESS